MTIINTYEKDFVMDDMKFVRLRTHINKVTVELGLTEEQIDKLANPPVNVITAMIEAFKLSSPEADDVAAMFTDKSSFDSLPAIEKFCIMLVAGRLTDYNLHTGGVCVSMLMSSLVSAGMAGEL